MLNLALSTVILFDFIGFKVQVTYFTDLMGFNQTQRGKTMKV